MSHSAEIVGFFAKFIEKHLGIVYLEANFYQLESRLKDIVNLLGLKDLQELHNKAVAGITSEMKQLVLDLATNNETLFFRDTQLFTEITSSVLPKMQAAGSLLGGRVRVWSAACSSGQEPYSIAMALEEANLNGSRYDYSILATDISSRILLRARQGQYSHLEVQRGLTSTQLAKYFTENRSDDTQGTYTVGSQLKAHVSFRSLNLLSNWPDLGRFNIIFCRNVLIYQSIENKKKVLSALVRQLEPGGYLILGAAESVLGLSDDFELEMFGKVNLYRVKQHIHQRVV